MGQPLPANLAGGAPDQQIDFWHSLTDQSITTNDQAFHGLLLYADGKDDSPDYASRVRELKKRKWLPSGFNSPADAGVTRGTVATAICRIARIKGGLTMHVLGPIPRYAVRELMFLSIYPPSTPNQSFSGTQFVGIIGAVEDYQRGNRVTPPENFPEPVSAQK